MPETESRKLKIAVIGSGISGISACYSLKNQHHVDLYESSSKLGGHTNSVEISSLDSTETCLVDTGFIVCNPVTYPNFMAMMESLQVNLVPSNMSFAVSRSNGFEWAGRNLNTVFCQRSNILNPKMYRMVYDILRFNSHASRLASESDALLDSAEDHPLKSLTMGEFFEKEGYSTFFYENYILPMTAAIWSSPADTAFSKFPMLTLVNFLRNHCLLQVGKRPVWQTVENGSRNYIEKALDGVENIFLNTKVAKVSRHDSRVTVKDQDGNEKEYDYIIIATHSDQALKILGEDVTATESEILSKIAYSKNKAYLHRDTNLMPKSRIAWSAWNYLSESKSEKRSTCMTLSYCMNILQPWITSKFGDVIVTLNPFVKPNPDLVLGEFEYEHPVYSRDGVEAQLKLDTIQGDNRTFFAGAWTNYGFHEDGCTSGLLAGLSLGGKVDFEVALNGGYPTKRKAYKSPEHVDLEGLIKKPKYGVVKKVDVDYSILATGAMVLVAGIAIYILSQ